MIYNAFCPSLEGTSLSSKYRETGTSSSAGAFALLDIETLVLPEAESQTRQCNSTSLAQVLQANSHPSTCLLVLFHIYFIVFSD